jgi:hypothetical protein
MLQIRTQRINPDNCLLYNPVIKMISRNRKSYVSMTNLCYFQSLPLISQQLIDHLTEIENVRHINGHRITTEWIKHLKEIRLIGGKKGNQFFKLNFDMYLTIMMDLDIRQFNMMACSCKKLRKLRNMVPIDYVQSLSESLYEPIHATRQKKFIVTDNDLSENEQEYCEDCGKYYNKCSCYHQNPFHDPYYDKYDDGSDYDDDYSGAFGVDNPYSDM